MKTGPSGGLQNHVCAITAKYTKEGNEEKNAVRTDKIRAPEYICGT
jgi:hypothetical protein